MPGVNGMSLPCGEANLVTTRDDDPLNDGH
jgi:hypothetical protein